MQIVLVTVETNS